MSENCAERNVVHQTAEAKRFEYLDRLAFDFARVQTDVNKLSSLNFEEHAYVMSMAYLYTIHLLGRLSVESCKKVKERRIKECRQIHNSYEFTRHLHKRWVLCTKNYALEKQELVEMLKEKNPAALRKALQIIDLLSGEYIYTRLADKVYDWNEQIVFVENVVDEVCDETEYEDREGLKQVVYKIIDALESGELIAPAEYMDESELCSLVGEIPLREPLTEEIMSGLMPRVK